MFDEAEYLLCAIDGGGTGCRVEIARPDGGKTVRATGGPANYASDPAQAIANVSSALRSALKEAGLEYGDATRCVAHAGLAGVMTDKDASAVAAQLPFGTCTVSDDRLTTVTGALGDRDGALLSAGTGTFVAARRNGEVTLFGGWGLKLGDQASGAWLGRAAMEFTLLAYDGFEAHSDLTRSILAHFDDTPANMVAFGNRATPNDFANFAPSVVEAAAAGDATGLALLRRGADYLNAGLHLVGVTENDTVCLVGGLGPHYSAYLERGFRRLVRPPEGTALEGALFLAKQRLKQKELEA